MAFSVEGRARVIFGVLLLAVALAALAWYLLAAARYRTYEIRSPDSVSGLIAGAPVEFHGVEVGQVRSVRLLGPRQVRILADVRDDAPVSSATVATITGRGLAARGFTGYVYISLEDRGAAGQPLQPASGSSWPQIAALPSQTTSLDTAMQQLNQSVQAASALLQGVLDPGTVASLKQSLANLDEVSRTLSAHSARLGTILANAEKASGQVGPLLQSSQESVLLLRQQLLPQAQSTLRDLDALSASMGSILVTTQQASTRVEPLLQSSNDAVRALQNQVLPQAQRALVRLDHLSTSLDDATTRIKRDPSVLLRGGADAPGPGEGP